VKQIRINVPLTVTRETQDTIAEPIYGYGLPFQTSGRFFVRQTIDALCGAVRVTIVGDKDAVQSMLANQKNDPTALIQRALSALGYVVGDHKKDVEQFSRWIDHLVAFPRSEEALTLWTSAMLARLGSAEPPMIAETVDEASEAALRVVVQRMRLFPPAQKTGLDDGPPIEWDRIKITGVGTYEECAELVAWREAAKACGIKSPADLDSMKNASFGEFVDKKITHEWRSATDCLTPAQAKSKIDTLEQRERAWCAVTDRGCPVGARERIEDLRAQIKEQADTIAQWQAATGCETSEAAKSFLVYNDQTWRSATDRACPGDAKQRIEDLQMQVKMQAETIRQRERDLSEWRKATGVEYPDGAIARARADLDAWQEATGASNSHQAYKMIQELKAQVLSYASEIDALRKAAKSTPDPVVVNIEHGAHVTLNGQTIGHVHNPERELAKVRAELDSKRRECQTEKERADENARTMNARGVLLDKIAEALGLSSIVNYDKLSEHVADMREEWRKDEDTISQVRVLLAAKPGESVLDAARRAIVPLPKPEKVESGQKWSFVMTAQSGREAGNSYLVGRFKDEAGKHYAAFDADIVSGFYLGT
jgi:hypothetical protein